MMIAAALYVSALAIQPTEVRREFVWNSERYGERRHEAVEMVPESWNGWVVVLLGGGLISDEDWYVPPELTNPSSGETQSFTLDGEPTRDAKTIGDALVGRGYRVWRWSSIHVDDPIHTENQAMGTPVPFESTVEQAMSLVPAMLDASGQLEGAVLIGHSLGASRAVHAGASDDRVRGFVFLAGARLTPTPDKPSVISARAIVESGFDHDSDGVLRGDELSDELKARWDADGDGVVRGWEIAGTDAALTGGWPEADRDSQLAALIECRKPALALFGGLDTMSVHGPVLAMEAARAQAPIEVMYVADRGHQLSIEEGDLCDDIDAAVVERLADWIDGVREAEQ